MDEYMCPRCDVQCVWSETVRNQTQCPECDMIGLHFEGNLPAIMDVIAPE